MSFQRQAGESNRRYVPLAGLLNALGWQLPVLVLPLFLINVLHAGPIAVGIVEGVAGATQSLTRIGVGVLSDRFGRRKAMTAAGYALPTAARAFLLVITAWPLVVASRFVDQVGVGLRGSPREALLADSALAGRTGDTFGRLRSMESLGSAGSFLTGAAVIYAIQGNTVRLGRPAFQALVGFGILFGLAALVVAVLGIRDIAPETPPRPGQRRKTSLTQPFVVFLGINVLLALGTSSDAFLMLRTQGLGATTLAIVLGLGGFSLLYAGAAQPLGRVSDRIGKRRLIAAGWLLSAVAYLGFALAPNLLWLAVMLIPYGLSTALTAGIGQALIADLVPTGARGGAYGVFSGTLGLAGLGGSVVAGALYQFSVPAPFYLGALVAVVATVLLPAVRFPSTPSAPA